MDRGGSLLCRDPSDGNTRLASPGDARRRREHHELPDGLARVFRVHARISQRDHPDDGNFRAWLRRCEPLRPLCEVNSSSETSRNGRKGRKGGI